MYININNEFDNINTIKYNKKYSDVYKNVAVKNNNGCDSVVLIKSNFPVVNHCFGVDRGEGDFFEGDTPACYMHA